MRVRAREDEVRAACTSRCRLARVVGKPENSADLAPEQETQSADTITDGLAGLPLVR